MPAVPPGRSKGGNKVSKLDRDTSKKNVALSKAKQREAMAAKNFAQHQKQIKKDRDAILKLKKSIDGMMDKLKEDQTLDRRFMGQVIKKVKALQNFDKYVKASAQQHSAGVQQPKMYTAIVKDAGKVPKINTVNTIGDFTVFLAMAIVILNRILAMKPAK